MARFGSIGTQYFDNAGDPLIEGKLFFFESGSTTDKDTFSDVGLAQDKLNENPVELSAAGRQPNIFFSGSVRVVLTKNDGTQIEVRDPIGGEGLEGSFAPWNALTIYNKPDIVIRNDLFYISIADANQANDPVLSPINWSQIKFLGVYNTNQTYVIDDIAQGSDGLLYISRTNGNISNDPTTDGTNWKPASKSADTSGPALSFFLGTG